MADDCAWPSIFKMDMIYACVIIIKALTLPVNFDVDRSTLSHNSTLLFFIFTLPCVYNLELEALG